MEGDRSIGVVTLQNIDYRGTELRINSRLAATHNII